MPGPVKPSEVASQKKTVIPEFVFEAFNELITKNFNRGSATVLQKNVVALIRKKQKGISSKKVFDEHWLDVEEAYRDAGWEVKYDKPAYCETYDASFTFKQKTKMVIID